MTFREFKGKARWFAFFGGLRYIRWSMVVASSLRRPVQWVDRTPPSLNLLGVFLTSITFVLGLLTLPRWQSIIALLACLLVTFIFVQGI